MFLEEPNEANEGIRVRCLPEFGAEQATRRKHGGQHVQALASFGFDQVALSLGCPGTSIGVNLRKSSLVDVGQHHVARRSLLPQLFDFLLRSPEVSLVPFF